MWNGSNELARLQLRFAKNDAFGVIHKLNAAPAANVAFNWPTVLPGSTQAITVDSAGNMGYSSLGGGGSVNSVALSLPNIFNVSGSPVTASGTLTATLVNQGAGLVFAAPAGASGAPVFRALTDTDLPSLTTAKISDFATAADARIDAKITGVIRYKGTYSGAAASPPANPAQGDQYRINVAGSTAFGFQVNVGDYVLYNGTTWDKIDATDPTVTGTANRVTITPTGDTSYGVDIASTYAGQSSIVTVGNLIAGVWNATTIAIEKGGTGSTTVAGARGALSAAGKFTGTITSAGITAGKFTVVHNLNNLAPEFSIFDNTAFKVIPDNVKAVDANTLEIELSAASFGTITGTYNFTVVG